MLDLILQIIMLCNIHSGTYIPIDSKLRYSIIVNDIVIKKNEKLPDYLFQDMTDDSGKNVSVADEDYLLDLDPNLLIVDNMTINIKCTKE